MWSKSSPVFTMTVRSSASTIFDSPSTNFAPPTPPAKATILSIRSFQLAASHPRLSKEPGNLLDGPAPSFSPKIGWPAEEDQPLRLPRRGQTERVDRDLWCKERSAQ